MIARILTILCTQEYFRQELAKQKNILEVLVTQLTMNQLIISDECLEYCLAALAMASKATKETCSLLHQAPHFLDQLPGFLRHPDKQIKLYTSRILCNLNKYHKLPKEIAQLFKWIIMQLVSLLPLSATQGTLWEFTQITEICEII